MLIAADGPLIVGRAPLWTRSTHDWDRMSGTPDTLACPRDLLADWMQRLLARCGMFAVDAELVLARLLENQARGRPSEGIRQIESIARRFDQGDADPRARTLTSLDLPAAAILSGSTGIPEVCLSRGMQLAIDKARTQGVALVVVSHTHPVSSLAVYAEMAAAAGQVGSCGGNFGAATLTAGSASPNLSSHPQAWAIPGGDDTSLWSAETCLDVGDLDGPVSSQLRALLQGLTTVALTAGLTGGKTPAARSRGGAGGAEYVCSAINIAAFPGVSRWSSMLQDVTSEGHFPRSVRKTVTGCEDWNLTEVEVAALESAGRLGRVPWTGPRFA